MPTMRTNVSPYSGKAHYGLADCLEEWPAPYRTDKQIRGRRKGGLITPEAEGLDPDDVAPLSELRYEPVETGVGCAEHADPACLCDVVVTEPVQIAVSTCDYEYAALSDEPQGSHGWWLNILAVHDALTGIDKMVSAAGSITRGTRPFAGTDMVRLSLDFQNDSMSPKQIALKWGISDMNQIKYFRRKAICGSGRERK